ncbi:5'-3' exonuclease, partial [Baffinella frigidus]
SLVGDASDGVKGVPGIGPKTAALLLNDFQTLDELLDKAGTITQQKKRRESLIEHRETALIARSLVRLQLNAPHPDVHPPPPIYPIPSTPNPAYVPLLPQSLSLMCVPYPPYLNPSP